MTRPHRPHPGAPDSSPAITVAVAVLLIILICTCWAGFFAVTDHDCRERGGHTEWVWGGKGGWTCDGADR